MKVLVISFFLTVISLEILLLNYDLDAIRGIVRNFSGERLNDCLIVDEILDHKLLPNCHGIIKTRDFEVSFKTNSLGFRDREITEKKNGVKRVLIIGDSFAEGWGVNLAERFDQIESPDYEFFNMGTRSYSPVLEYELLKQYVDIVKPDIVITMLDFSDLHDDFYYTKKSISPSKLYETVYIQASILIANKKREITESNLTYDFSLFAKASEWEGYDNAWDFTISNLDKTTDFLKYKGVIHKIAVIPRGIHVGETEWNEGREILGIEKSKLYNAPKIFEISDIDLLTPLKEAEKEFKGELYYPFDGHWSVKGHSVVKQAFQKLIDNKMM